MGEWSGCVAVLYGISAGQKVHIPNESIWTVLHSGQEHTNPHKQRHTHYSFWRQCYEPYSPVCPLHWWVQCWCIMSLQPCILMSELLPKSLFCFPCTLCYSYLFIYLFCCRTRMHSRFMRMSSTKTDRKTEWEDKGTKERMHLGRIIYLPTYLSIVLLVKWTENVTLVFQSCSTSNYVICSVDFCNLINNSLSWSLLINKAVQDLKSTQFLEKSNPMCFQFKTRWFY